MKSYEDGIQEILKDTQAEFTKLYGPDDVDPETMFSFLTNKYAELALVFVGFHERIRTMENNLNELRNQFSPLSLTKPPGDTDSIN